jgi:hypothetical protein
LTMGSGMGESTIMDLVLVGMWRIITWATKRQLGRISW